jgi:hypothetical protein
VFSSNTAVVFEFRILTEVSNIKSEVKRWREFEWGC